jgi:guanylate kinase
MKVLGNTPKGLVFVISAPAGTGKTTLVRMLTGEFPEAVVESVSFTTRSIRPGEVSGRDYYFVSAEEFAQKKAAGEFLENATVFGHEYGTSKHEVLQEQKKGKHVALVIDTQGALKLKEQQFPAIFIFLAPPSVEELRERLFKRKRESKEHIEERLNFAAWEMEKAQQYDYRIVNDSLPSAYDVLRSIFIAEEHKIRNKKI